MTYKTRKTHMVSHHRRLEMMVKVSFGIQMRLEVFMILIRICFSGLLLMVRGRLGLMLDLMGFGIIRDSLIRARR